MKGNFAFWAVLCITSVLTMGFSVTWSDQAVLAAVEGALLGASLVALWTMRKGAHSDNR